MKAITLLLIGFIINWTIPKIGSHPNYTAKKIVYNQVEPNLIGVWVMVKSEKDGFEFFDDSIREGYTYTYAKNGDFILDIRIVRQQTSELNLRIIDFPRFKWKAENGEIEIRAIDEHGKIFATHVDYYNFSADTLVIRNSNLTSYYLRKK
ncbi:hypothetical protein [Algoriphagus boritolerans]|uniref:Lipocalin-like domain-containing protein n=1 Tax=Algoriphagus boritolerans DSM 17298 = JCM 18970 TaxID=1120964 RepID=A0A1H5WBH8_9BACT|nr:hypothetical protein [Algoriphagus boritolerans]SEF96177.1 hypothetical protein SAMN03080598_01989 [Algoriphagus boritolerans DSM 17298 = JCM 18970]